MSFYQLLARITIVISMIVGIPLVLLFFGSLILAVVSEFLDIAVNNFIDLGWIDK